MKWTRCEFPPDNQQKVIILFKYGVVGWGWFDGNSWMHDEPESHKPEFWINVPDTYGTP
jgi:hypothetical protein